MPRLKNLINIDEERKLIRRYAVTDASVHDSQIVDEPFDGENGGRSIWADLAHASAPEKWSLAR